MWLVASENGLTALMKRYAEASERIDEELRRKLSKAKYDKLMEDIENSGVAEEIERMSRSFYRLIVRKGNTMAKYFEMATEQELPEQADFFEAYAQALRKPPLDQKGALTMEKSTNVSHIYIVMVLNWKHVRKLPSASMCYSWLCNVLGGKKIGNEERIQKICCRFGVNFSRRKCKKRKKKRRNRK